jgi:hypothetical protein
MVAAAAWLWISVLPGWLSVALAMVWQWCKYGNFSRRRAFCSVFEHLTKVQSLILVSYGFMF